MKLALGTSQFGLDYGIANVSGKLDEKIIKQVLDFALISGIRIIDTAQGYGDAEKIIGNFGISDFQVITKVSSNNLEKTKCDLKTKIYKSLDLLNVKKLYGVLVHDASSLIKNDKFNIMQSLIQLKDEGLIKNIGISIYDPQDVNYFVPDFQIDIVQCPFNILDRRILKNNFLRTLHDNSIELHVRSIFLQGLLLMDRKFLPSNFMRWSNLFNKWFNWLRANDISNLEACLIYVNSFPQIDQIIFGVDNLIHLKSIIKMYKNLKNIDIPDFSSEDADLINPTNWKID